MTQASRGSATSSGRARRRTRRRLIFGLILALALVVAAKPVALMVARTVYPYPYREIVEHEAARYDLDPLFVVSVMRIESGFSPEVRSHRGAQGLMQLMPSTAAWVARKSAFTEYQPNRLAEPEVNVRLGCWYLSYLRRQFPGDLPMVLAAYNAGEGNVARWKREPGEVTIAYPETRHYMQRGMRTYRIYRLLYREWSP